MRIGGQTIALTIHHYNGRIIQGAWGGFSQLGEEKPVEQVAAQSPAGTVTEYHRIRWTYRYRTRISLKIKIIHKSHPDGSDNMRHRHPPPKPSARPAGFAEYIVSQTQDIVKAFSVLVKFRLRYTEVIPV